MQVHQGISITIYINRSTIHEHYKVQRIYKKLNFANLLCNHIITQFYKQIFFGLHVKPESK